MEIFASNITNAYYFFLSFTVQKVRQERNDPETKDLNQSAGEQKHAALIRSDFKRGKPNIRKIPVNIFLYFR